MSTMPLPEMNDPLADITRQINALNLDAKGKKEFLRKLVAANWPELPGYSTLSAPKVEEVQKAVVGTGVVMTFKEHGIQKAVVVKVGTHYAGARYAADPAVPTYMIPGGFIDLTQTPGSSSVPADATKGEHPRVGALREIEEEMVDDKGSPVLGGIDPSRLKPMDTKTISIPNGDRSVVIGLHLELNPDEARKLKEHVQRLETDDTYRHAVREHTINPETNKPEICTISILPLAEIAAGKHNLLHKDQISLFQLINDQVAQGVAR